MRILITGASGALGEYLTPELLQVKTFSVRILAHRSPISAKQEEVFTGDIEDAISMSKACYGIHTVFHLAALTHSSSKKSYFQTNENGTKVLVAACVKNKVRRIIYISSSAASEDGGDYARSKLQGEEIVRESGLDYVILRVSEVYGGKTGEGIDRLNAWINIFPLIPIVGNGSYPMSPVHIDDLTQGMLAVLNNNLISKITLNFCGPEEMTLSDLVNRLTHVKNLKRLKIFIPLWLTRLSLSLLSVFKPNIAVCDQLPRLLCDKDHSIKETQALINYNPRTIEEGLTSFSDKNT